MNIAEQLAVMHSRANADKVLDYVLADRRRVRPLLDAFAHEDLKIAQRAGMVVGDLGRARPDWYLPYHTELIDHAVAFRHPAMPRNVLRYFSELPLDKVTEEDQGPLLDVAFRYTADPEVPVGIRVFAMTIVQHFCVPYPELREELRGVIELALAEGQVTPGFVSRGRKVLAAL